MTDHRNGSGMSTVAIDTDVCFCCLKRPAEGAVLRHDLLAWWQPTYGHGYGPDGKLITLCEDCVKTLQFFVELGGKPPPK